MDKSESKLGPVICGISSRRTDSRGLCRSKWWSTDVGASYVWDIIKIHADYAAVSGGQQMLVRIMCGISSTKKYEALFHAPF